MLHAELVEQLTMGEAQDRGGGAAGLVADHPREQHSVAVGVVPARPRRSTKLGRLGKGRLVGHIELHLRRGIKGAAPIGIERLAELDAAVHAQQIVDGDRVARILGIAPGRNRRRRLDCELFLPHQDADQRVGDRFGHRPADLRCLGAIARRVAFGDDVTVVQDHHRLGPAMRAALGLGELAVECRFEGGVGGIDGQRLGGVVRWRRRITAHRGSGGALVRDAAGAITGSTASR